MTAEIFRTSNMEEAILYMASNHHLSAIYQTINSWCPRNIKLKHGLIKDANPILVRAWQEYAESQIEDLRKNGGLVLYRDKNKPARQDKFDSITMIEMPVLPENFYRIYALAEKELIVYIPPDWSMHQEKLTSLFPLSQTVINMMKVVEDIRGQHESMSKMKKDVLEYCLSQNPKMERSRCAVFECQEIDEAAHVPNSTFSRMFGIRRLYKRYEVLRPMVPPQEDDPIYADKLNTMYESLLKVPDIGGGVRALYCGVQMPHVGPKAFGLIRMLKKQKSVMAYKDICVMEKDFPKIDYDLWDAQQEAKRKQHYKLREFIEDKPYYPPPKGK